VSVKAMNWAWDVPGLSTAQRVVLVKIADCADAQRFQAWPSIPYLAGMACLSERQVMRVVAELQAMELLSREPWKGRNGKGRSRRDESTYLYTLQVTQERMEFEGAAPDGVTPGQIVTGDNDDDEPLTSAQGTPDIGDNVPLTCSRARADKEEPTTEPTTEATADESAPPPAEPAVQSRTDYGRYAREWNDAALKNGLPQIDGLTRERRGKLRTRLGEPGFKWVEILARLEKCIGGWLHEKGLLDFDFVVKNEKGYTRLLEGRYDKGIGADGRPLSFRDADAQSAVAAAERFVRGE